MKLLHNGWIKNLLPYQDLSTKVTGAKGLVGTSKICNSQDNPRKRVCHTGYNREALVLGIWAIFSLPRRRIFDLLGN